MAGSRVSPQIIAHSITLPPPACVCATVHPSNKTSSCKRRIRTRPSTWCRRKRGTSDQTIFFYSSRVQFLSSHAHCRRCRLVTGIGMSIRSFLNLCIPIFIRVRCTVCRDTLHLWPTLKLSAFCATVTLLFVLTRWGNLRSAPAAGPHPWFFFLGPASVCSHYGSLWAPHRCCSFGNTLTQSSDHNDLVFKIL